MDYFKSMDVAASGMTAERFRMDLISENIANVNTTATISGEPYRKKFAVITPYDEPEFIVPASMNGDEDAPFVGSGVKVDGVMEDTSSDFKYVYDPDNPSAIKTGKMKGYVAMPNINIITEMTNMIAASRGYEANVSSVQTAKQIAQKALEIGKGGF